MDDTYRVVLFGHRDFNEHRTLDEQLFPLLKDLIRTKPYVEIYIGRNGAFDLYAATVVKRVQIAMGKANNVFICVLPYPEKDMKYYEKYYDSLMIPESIGRLLCNIFSFFPIVFVTRKMKKNLLTPR